MTVQNSFLIRWGIILIAGMAPFGGWLLVFGCLNLWNLPATAGTVSCWRTECAIAIVLGILCGLAYRQGHRRMWIAGAFAYVVISMFLLAGALLTQVYMLMPLDS
ncbi:MAG TPA: hypothetical protein P5186_27765 [Candidatus Paceibacterota bacterium]|nr:hypothetical protein [Verrucomicrobiota bacterium]HRY51849.1 hypothetical protein [Candidatus Paceibacterota bacterium]